MPKSGALPAVQKIRVSELNRIIRGDSGSVILVNAWATWCKPCRDEMPGLLNVWKRRSDKPFRLILLSADDISEIDSKVRPALRDFGVTFTTYIMSDSTDDAFINGLNPEWNGALPATFVYDARGHQIHMSVGEQSGRKFEEALDKAMRR